MAEIKGQILDNIIYCIILYDYKKESKTTCAEYTSFSDTIRKMVRNVPKPRSVMKKKLNSPSKSNVRDSQVPIA